MHESQFKTRLGNKKKSTKAFHRPGEGLTTPCENETCSWVGKNPTFPSHKPIPSSRACKAEQLGHGCRTRPPLLLPIHRDGCFCQAACPYSSLHQTCWQKLSVRPGAGSPSTASVPCAAKKQLDRRQKDSYSPLLLSGEPPALVQAEPCRVWKHEHPPTPVQLGTHLDFVGVQSVSSRKGLQAKPISFVLPAASSRTAFFGSASCCRRRRQLCLSLWGHHDAIELQGDVSPSPVRGDFTALCHDFSNRMGSPEPLPPQLAEDPWKHLLGHALCSVPRPSGNPLGISWSTMRCQQLGRAGLLDPTVQRDGSLLSPGPGGAAAAKDAQKCLLSMACLQGPGISTT